MVLNKVAFVQVQVSVFCPRSPRHFCFCCSCISLCVLLVASTAAWCARRLAASSSFLTNPLAKVPFLVLSGTGASFSSVRDLSHTYNYKVGADDNNNMLMLHCHLLPSLPFQSHLFGPKNPSRQSVPPNGRILLPMMNCFIHICCNLQRLARSSKHIDWRLDCAER